MSGPAKIIRAFQAWRQRRAAWTAEWALIQQELGRRREQGGWS